MKFLVALKVEGRNKSKNIKWNAITNTSNSLEEEMGVKMSNFSRGVGIRS